MMKKVSVSKLILSASSLLIATICTCCAKDTTQEINDNYHTTPWLTKLKMIKHNPDQKFRILQFGDSHTAGGVFTKELGDKLQQYYGNGGIGMVYPIQIRGQRIVGVTYLSNGWEALSSRLDKGDFPLGGIMASAISSQNNVTLNLPELTGNKLYKFTIAVNPNNSPAKMIFSDSRGNIPHATDGIIPTATWQTLTFYASPPLSYHVEDGTGYLVGNIQIENSDGGVVLSAMGINGAQLNQWARWNPSYLQQLKDSKADLVILSYGTNEGLNNNLKFAETKALWLHTIDTIKATLPNAGILIIGAPESLKSLHGICGIRPQNLSTMQEMQYEVAKTTGVSYWSWQDAMGGACSMKKLISHGYARKDGVHFTEKGYELFADKLADDIINGNLN